MAHYCSPAGMESDDSEGFDDYFPAQPEDEKIKPKFATGNGAVNGSFNNKTAEEDDLFQNNSDAPVNKWLNMKDKNVTLKGEDFYSAIRRGNIPMIEKMIEAGFAIDTVLKGGWAGLMCACSYARPQVVELLLKHGADPNLHKDFFTPLMAACSSSQTDNEAVLACVEQVLKAGSKVDEQDRYHTTALLYAARDGRLDVVKKLVEAGADVNKYDSKGWTALAWAASRGQGPTVRLLLEYQADNKRICSTGQTPSELAYSEGHKEIAEILDGATSKIDSLNKLQPTKPEFPPDDAEFDDIENRGDFADNNNFSTLAHYSEVEMLLCGLDLQRLLPIFKNHEITFDLVLRMSDADFEKIGVEEFGTRQRLLDTIHKIHKKEWEQGSIGSLEARRQLTCVDAVGMTANIGRHCSYIGSSIAYLSDKIRTNPKILELGQEGEDVHALFENVQIARKNVKNLDVELKRLEGYLDKVKDNANLNSGDRKVTKNGQKGQKTLIKLAVISSSAIILAAGTLWMKPGLMNSIPKINRLHP